MSSNDAQSNTPHMSAASAAQRAAAAAAAATCATETLTTETDTQRRGEKRRRSPFDVRLGALAAAKRPRWRPIVAERVDAPLASAHSVLCAAPVLEALVRQLMLDKYHTEAMLSAPRYAMWASAEGTRAAVRLRQVCRALADAQRTRIVLANTRPSSAQCLRLYARRRRLFWKAHLRDLRYFNVDRNRTARIIDLTVPSSSAASSPKPRRLCVRPAHTTIDMALMPNLEHIVVRKHTLVCGVHGLGVGRCGVFAAPAEDALRQMRRLASITYDMPAAIYSADAAQHYGERNDVGTGAFDVGGLRVVRTLRLLNMHTMLPTLGNVDALDQCQVERY